MLLICLERLLNSQKDVPSQTCRMIMRQRLLNSQKDSDSNFQRGSMQRRLDFDVPQMLKNDIVGDQQTACDNKVVSSGDVLYPSIGYVTQAMQMQKLPVFETSHVYVSIASTNLVMKTLLQLSAIRLSNAIRSRLLLKSSLAQIPSWKPFMMQAKLHLQRDTKGAATARNQIVCRIIVNAFRVALDVPHNADVKLV
ncbi:unnamed protein product [Cochlearia groenlandica]